METDRVRHFEGERLPAWAVNGIKEAIVNCLDAIEPGAGTEAEIVLTSGDPVARYHQMRMMEELHRVFTQSELARR